MLLLSDRMCFFSKPGQHDFDRGLPRTARETVEAFPEIWKYGTSNKNHETCISGTFTTIMVTCSSTNNLSSPVNQRRGSLPYQTTTSTPPKRSGTRSNPLSAQLIARHIYFPLPVRILEFRMTIVIGNEPRLTMSSSSTILLYMR